MKIILHLFSGLFLTGLLLTACEKHDFSDTGALVPPTVVEDPSLSSILINGTHLHAEAFGNPANPMVVALHGGPGGDYRSILNYKDLVDDSMFVVFYDQRGSGLSERHDWDHYDDKDIQMYLDDLSAVIAHYRHHSSQQVILAGHSWGAMLATAYINRYPDAVDGAILSEPGGFNWPQTEAYISRSFAIKPFEERTNDATYLDQIMTSSDHNALDYRFAHFSTPEPNSDNELHPAWRIGAVHWIWAQTYANENPGDMDFTANLGQYSTKVLFAYSENNEAYGKAHAELLSSAYPNVQLEEIPDCGHEIPHAGWTHFYPLVTNYLTELF